VVDGMTVMRIEYRDPDTGTPRDDPTGHGESLIDMESYLLPLDQVRGSSLLSFGVAAGLGVRAVPGQPGLTVTPGAALDGAGRMLVLVANGVAVVDPAADPDDPRNIATVTVPAAGLRLESAGLTGPRFLTLRSLEVLRTNIQGNVPVLLHAPWLRLQPVGGFQDVGDEVVLARVELDGAGNVTGLSAESRRSAGVVAGRVELRVPQAQAGTGLEQVSVGELRGQAGGGVELAVGPAGNLRSALAVEPVPGDQLRLSIRTDTVVASRADGSAALTADIAGGKLTVQRPDGATTLTLDTATGNLGLGVAPLAMLHAKDSGDLGPEDATGVLTSSHVPLLAQSDGTAVGVLNADGRPAFALDIEDDNHTPTERGVPTLSDFFDGARHLGISLKQGRVGIGTKDPAEKLTVEGAGARIHGVTVGTKGRTVDYDWEYESVGVSEPLFNLRLQSPNAIAFHTGGSPPTERMLLDRGGLLSLTGRLEVHGVSCANSFCNLSDARLKSDLEELTGPLDAVGRLRAVSFRWREDLAEGPGGPVGSELAGRGSIGLLAQEVAEVYPELVTAVGADQYLALNYQGLTAVLLEAVKELKAESERLRGRLDQLELRASAAPGG
jgi:hypothetical protein